MGPARDPSTRGGAPVPDVVFDMATKDPDDVLTLCLVATHPSVRLAAVTVTPGTFAPGHAVR